MSEKDQAAAAAASGISMKTVDAGTSRASVLRQGDADLGKVVENRLLTSPNAPAKRHIGEYITCQWAHLEAQEWSADGWMNHSV